jgi:23S rRNA pseudouridine1911/1915/1917 synthase
MSSQMFVVGRHDADQTVAAFLRVRLSIPWSKSKKLVESGQVRVAGQPCSDPAFRLKLGKKVEVAMERAAEPRKTDRLKVTRVTLPQAPKYDGPEPVIVYSDDMIVVVDKPAGLTTMRHPEEAEEFGEQGKKFLPTTLADLLPAMLGQPGKKVRAVHRIDKDTTGLVIFARTKMAEAHLVNQFRNHTTSRRYLALTRGHPKSGRIETNFVRDRGDGRRGSKEEEEGQRAATSVNVLEEFGPYSLVECRLETGRTHQVRIHLGEAGAPLCGERVYDRPLNGQPFPDNSGAKRTMLHAAELGVVHPITEEAMRWESAMPSDMRDLLARLQAKG